MGLVLQHCSRPQQRAYGGAPLMELQARTPRHEAKEHAWHLVYGDVQ